MSESEKEINKPVVLTPVQIGDIAGQDALMSIEINSVTDDLFAIILFAIVIFVCTFTGLYGPTSEMSGWDQIIFNTAPSNSLHQKISQITPTSQYLDFYIDFHHEKAAEDSIFKVLYQFRITLFSKGKIVRKTEGTKDEKLEFKAGSDSCDRIQLYSDRKIDFDTAEIDIEFQNPQSCFDAVLLWSQGDPNYSIFISWVRLIFAVATFIVTILFIYRLRQMNHPMNMYQKFTIFIQIIAIVAANPLYIAMIWHPSPNLITTDTILRDVFEILILAFLLLFYDLLRTKGKGSGVLTTVVAIFSTIQCFFKVTVDYYVGIGYQKTDSKVRDYVIFTNVFYVLYGMFYFILTLLCLLKTDPTEKHQFWVYNVIFMITIISMLLPKFISKISMFEGTAASFIIKFAAMETLTLLMAYFHWPFESKIDTQYDNASDQQEIGDFAEEFDEDQLKKKIGHSDNVAEEA